jgi:repressor LexA
MVMRSNRILTQKQQDTLAFVQQYLDRYDKAPTLDEIAKEFGITISTAADRLRGLRKKGFIMKSPHSWRNLSLAHSLSNSHNRFISVPIMASVGADNLSVFADYEFSNFLKIQESLLNGYRDVFAVHVRGNSMRDADIHNGDYILAEEADLPQVNNGDKVIAVIGDMVTLKRFNKSGDKIVLSPENKNYSPIVVDGRQEDFKIVGRFIDVIPSITIDGDDDFSIVPVDGSL